MHTFQKGQALIKQGEVEQRLIVVLDGTVTVEQTVADTKVIIRQPTSAYVSIRRHTAAYAREQCDSRAKRCCSVCGRMLWHMLTYAVAYADAC